MSNLAAPAGPRTITVPGDGTNTLSVTLPPGVTLDVQAVLANIDAAGAGDTLAELTIAEQAGVVIATKRQGEPIPAGDTGTATWALRLDDEAVASKPLVTTDGFATVSPTDTLFIGKYLALDAFPPVAGLRGTAEWCAAVFTSNGQSAPHAPTFWVGATGVTTVWTTRVSHNWPPSGSPPRINAGNTQQIIVPETGVYFVFARMWGQTGTSNAGSIAGGAVIPIVPGLFTLAAGAPQQAGYFPNAPFAGFQPVIQQFEVFNMPTPNTVLTFPIDYQGAGVAYAGNVGGLAIVKVKS